MRDKTPQDLMQEIVYELKTITGICILTATITTITMVIACAYIIYLK